MKKKVLQLEHGNMMFHSQEIIQLSVPKEIDIMFYLILSLVFCVLVLLSTVKINDVVKVSGIVKTQVNNSLVKNVLSGEIERINYEPEQFVEKGFVLYSLKDDVYKSLIIDLENNIRTKQEELFCLEMLLQGFYSGKNIYSETDNLFVYSQLNEYFETVLYLENQTEIMRYRYEKEKEQPVVLYNKCNVDEAFMNMSLSQQDLKKYKANFLAEIVQKKKECESLLEKLEQEVVRTQEQYSFLEVKAPVSGYVQVLTLLNAGDYVLANQDVLMIVPDDAKNFRVELAIPPKDIGEITTGMNVKYRLSAFPFFEYKGADGYIETIDSDVRQNGDNRLYYRVRSDISRTSFVNNKGIEYPLRAGIEVDARIILEKISVVHFILRKLDFVK